MIILIFQEDQMQWLPLGLWEGGSTFRIRWFSVSATYTRSPLMVTPWGELKEASENVPSFLPLSGPGTEEMTRWKYISNILIRAVLIRY